MSELCDLDATELRRLIGTGEVSPGEVLESCIARTETVDPALNAMVATDYDRARVSASAAEAAVRNGEQLGPLHGLPVAIKDLQPTAGLRTTYGSLLHENDIPEADGRIVAAIRAAGGIVMGKTNTPEFGTGGNTTNQVYGATGNPFNPELTCAGSSGGSAVALAAGMAPLASGSDFGGSLRTPAAFCGVVGFRPSPGLVPIESKDIGLSPFGVHGPMARNVADAALLLSAIVADDRRDPLSGPVDPRLNEPLQGADLSKLRLAVSEDLGAAPVDDNIRGVFRDRMKTVAGLFGEAQDRDPDLGRIHECFEILRGMEYVAGHGEQLNNHRDQLGPNVIDNTERGLAFTVEEVAWAYQEQTEIYRRYQALFDDVDVLICPAASVSPFPHAQLFVEEINGDAMPTYMRWLTLAYGLTMAIPVVAVIPCGVDHLGLPFGIQVAGPRGSDRHILEVAHAIETALATEPDLKRPLPDMAKLQS